MAATSNSPARAMKYRSFFLLIVAMVASSTSGRAADTKTNLVVTPLPSTRFHNLFRVTTNILSGEAPESDAAFAEIVGLGVKTLISVDGTRPDVASARKQGLRYIHLPFGYDGVTADRAAQLIRAAQTANGLIYVHCHHGMHRGPTAVAVICEGTAGWTTNQAVAWMKQAGTSMDYPGLYRSATEFRPPEPSALARIQNLPELAKTSTFIDTMVAMDEQFDRLKTAQKAGWKPVSNQTAIVPGENATILWEHLRELARLKEIAKRPEDFRTKLAVAEMVADQFRVLARDTRADATARDTAFTTLGQTCVACHRKYRD